MAIEWERLTFLATDGDKSIWTYATTHVRRDLLHFHVELPKYPHHDLIEAKAGIAIIFHGGDVMEKLIEPMQRISATIDRIADTIASEGMGTPVAKKGKPQ